RPRHLGRLLRALGRPPGQTLPRARVPRLDEGGEARLRARQQGAALDAASRAGRALALRLRDAPLRAEPRPTRARGAPRSRVRRSARRSALVPDALPGARRPAPPRAPRLPRERDE